MALSAHKCFVVPPPVCTRGRICTRQARSNTTRVRSGPSPHTIPSFNALSCAPEAFSAYRNQLLSRKATGSDRVRPSAYPSQPCRPGPFRSRVADDYARLDPVAIPLRVFIIRNLPVCAQALLRTQYPRSTLSRVRWRLFPHTGTSCCRGRPLTPTGYGLRPILPSLSSGPLPLTSRGRLRPPGVSCHSASVSSSLAIFPWMVL